MIGVERKTADNGLTTSSLSRCLLFVVSILVHQFANMSPQVLLLVSKKVPKRVYLPLVFGNSDDLEYARCTHIHEGPRYQTTRKEVAKLSGDNFSCVVGVIRHPLGMHGGNGLGSDVYALKVVDDLGDELSRDVYREVWAGGASGHW